MAVEYLTNTFGELNNFLLCRCGDKIVLHALCDCSFAEKVWRMRSSNHGWVKINMDGFTSMTDNWSTAGGVIRDSLGNWTEGFRKHLARCSIPNVELWENYCGKAVEYLMNKFGEGNLLSLVRKISAVKRYFQMVKTCPRGESELLIIDFPTFHVRKLLLENTLGNSFAKVN
ncbi:hypothetical protein ES332_D10G174200v1 [Gossypium tomentosum]|uniref:Uncharacterized protein n=1 Tax=Gossypium tomentosum TaxID=34277 RepID=A0A5D2J6V0_GOSTO|nr:hypothetical protein ES332_D10G174200v1 [Gossypium tomentosum]